MINVLGHKVYESFSAQCIDLDNCTIATLESEVEDYDILHETVIDSVVDSGTFYLADTDAGTETPIVWGRTGGQNPVIIVDAPAITMDMLKALIVSGIVPV